MNIIRIFIVLGIFVADPVIAQAADLNLTQEIPTCEMSPGRVLPAKYYALAEKWKEFHWVYEVNKKDSVVYGSGFEGLEGSGLYSSLYFYKMDINSDGLCDWIVIYQSAPLSMVSKDLQFLDTFYLGSEKNWVRIGLKAPKDKPDQIYTATENEYKKFALFADAPFVVFDRRDAIHYLIGPPIDEYHYGSFMSEPYNYGYQIYTWDSQNDFLRKLDKWDLGSAAAQVYVYFKQHGAVDPTQTGAGRIVRFDVKIEEVELDRGCKNQELVARSAGFAQACDMNR